MWINALVSIWNENSDSFNVFDDSKNSFKPRSEPLFKALNGETNEKYKAFCMTSNEVNKMNIFAAIFNFCFAFAFLFIIKFSFKYFFLIGVAYVLCDIVMTVINTFVKIYYPKMKLRTLNTQKISSLIIKYSNEKVSLNEKIKKIREDCSNCYSSSSRCNKCYRKKKADLEVISNRISYLGLLNTYIESLVEKPKPIEIPINPDDIDNFTKVNMFIKRLNKKTKNYPMIEETVNLLHTLLNKLKEKENGEDIIPNRLLIHLNEISDILDKLDSYSDNSSENQLTMLTNVVSELNTYISGLIKKTIDEKKTDVNISLKVMYNLLKNDNGPSDWNGGI